MLIACVSGCVARVCGGIKADGYDGGGDAPADVGLHGGDVRVHKDNLASSLFHCFDRLKRDKGGEGVMGSVMRRIG